MIHIIVRYLFMQLYVHSLVMIRDQLYCVSHFNPVTLSGGTNDPNFRGFMIQGRVVAGDSPTGEFTGESDVSQPQCDDDVSYMQ